MAGPSPSIQRAGRRRSRRSAAALAGALATVAGCSFVPKAKLDECHRVTQALRAENGQLKDRALDLRAQNHDLSQRAVDDARRISAQQEAVERLEKSVLAYQSEREKLADAVEVLKRQVRLSADPQPQPSASAEPPPSAGLGDRLRDFAGSRQGGRWTFDPKTGTLAVETGRLFEPDTTRLKPGAGDELRALADALKAGDLGEGQVLEVVGRAGTPSEGVRRAGYDEVEGAADEGRPVATGPEPRAGASSRFLGAARAARVRAALVEGSGLAEGRVRLAPPPDVAPDADTLDALRRGEGRVELRVADAAPGLDSRPSPGR
jgi:chemotaxis protein MotB